MSVKNTQRVSTGVYLILFLLLPSLALNGFVQAAATTTTTTTTTSSAVFPNPATDPTACRGDNTTSRVCDPNGLLGLTEMKLVQEYIVELEAQNVTCRDEIVPVQMAVFVENRMNAQRGMDLAKLAQQNAQEIHNTWGVGYSTTACGGTGLLLYMAVGDHQIYISRGKALTGVLSDDRLQYVIEKIKPDLKDERYGDALQLAVHLLTMYMKGHRPGFEDTAQGLLAFLGIIFAFGSISGGASLWKKHKERRNRHFNEQFRNDLTKLDRDRARALQGHYKATSCPICLEDFRNRNQDNVEKQSLMENQKNDSDLLGSDDKPVQLLSCGHVFDQKCWKEFARYPSNTRQTMNNDLSCPICRQPVSVESPSNLAARRAFNDVAYQDERRFRLQRLQYRYPTFVGTQYVDQWYDPSYRGSLLDDYDRRERQREAQLAAQRAEAERLRRQHQDASSGGVSTSGFGGGSADGGGVGGSW